MSVSAPTVCMVTGKARTGSSRLRLVRASPRFARPFVSSPGDSSLCRVRLPGLPPRPGIYRPQGTQNSTSLATGLSRRSSTKESDDVTNRHSPRHPFQLFAFSFSLSAFSFPFSALHQERLDLRGAKREGDPPAAGSAGLKPAGGLTRVPHSANCACDRKRSFRIPHTTNNPSPAWEEPRCTSHERSTKCSLETSP